MIGIKLVEKIIRNQCLFLLASILLFCSCGTVYIPQILPEARGVGKSTGQEDISVKIIPVTTNSLNSANNHPYIRRVIEASDLNQPAKLVSVEAAIAERLPPPVPNTPYRLGVGDELLITQESEEFVSQNESEELVVSEKRLIMSRSLTIADDGFVAILGI